MQTSEVEPLAALASARGLYYGAAVGHAFWAGDPAYRQLLTRHCNALVAENAMKWRPIHPAPETFAFDQADSLVAFAAEHRMRARGHCLVWHQAAPDWLAGPARSRADMLTVLQRHIHTVVGRYRGRVAEWDVVNEAVADDCSMRKTFWLERIGEDYLDHAFRLAHEADPDALLFYNDYGGECGGPKADRIRELVAGLLERKVPIHGVGLQCHFAPEHVRVEDIRKTIRSLTALGLQVAITELDIRLPLPVTADALTQQGQWYRELASMFYAEKGCRSLLTWGITDRYSWVPAFFRGFGAALPFDEQLQPKAAYEGLREAVRG